MSTRSGSYVDAAGPTIASDIAVIAQAVNAAFTATQAAQSASGAFIVAHGAAVLDQVSGPSGSPADSDIAGKDASD